MHRVEELITFANIHKHARPPKTLRSEDGTNLGHWVITQRKAYRRGSLSENQIKSLESIPGWTWNPYDDSWNSSYSILLDYAANHKRAVITPNKAINDGYGIGPWIETQRREYRKKKLSAERCKRLEAVPGWSWGAEKKGERRETVAKPRFSWGEFIDCLKSYKNRTGDLNVPSSHIDENGIALGAIVASVRSKFKNGRLTKEQISDLESMEGWLWRHPVLATYIRTDEQWDIIYGILLEYVKNKGHSIVPKGFITSDGKRLGYWVAGQRKAYREKKLSRERIQKLESLPGWDWGPGEKNWPRDYKRAIKAITGLSLRNIRQTHILPDGFRLGRWINHQRMDWRLGKLSEEQIRLLEDIPGWTWNTLETKWNEAYSMLLDYIQQTGSTHVPIQYKMPSNGFTLGQWVRIQIRLYRQGKLDQRRIKALSQLPEWKWE